MSLRLGTIRAPRQTGSGNPAALSDVDTTAIRKGRTVQYLVNSSLGAMKHCQLAHSANMAWVLAQTRKKWGMKVEIRNAQTGRLISAESLKATLVRPIGS